MLFLIVHIALSTTKQIMLELQCNIAAKHILISDNAVCYHQLQCPPLAARLNVLNQYGFMQRRDRVLR